MTVVRYNYDGGIKVDKKFLKPSYGFKVEVVCRLVHKKYVGVAEKSLRKQNLNLLVARKLAHFEIVEVVCYAEAVEQYFGVALGTPTIHLGELLFELAQSHTVLVCHLCLVV